MPERYLKPSYDEVREMSLTLYHKVRRSGYRPDVNVAIGRGGLFILRSIQDFYEASRIRIPYLVAVVERYSGLGRAGRVVIKYINAKTVRGKRVLLIDDVADYGESLLAVKNYLLSRGAREVKTATIHLKPWSRVEPDYYVARTDAWIIYPWEVYETIRLILEMLAERNATKEEAYDELVSKASITPQELSNFYNLVMYDKWETDERALSLLKELVEAFCTTIEDRLLSPSGGGSPREHKL